MTIVYIIDCLLVMIFREYISISEEKEVIKFKRNPCKIGRAAVPLSENWAVFSQFWLGCGACFLLLIPSLAPDPTLSFSPSRRRRPCSSFLLSQARAATVLRDLPPRQCRSCSRPGPFFAGHCRRLLAKPFLLFSLHSNGLEARWNPNPIWSMQCEAFSHGFQFLGGVWRV